MPDQNMPIIEWLLTTRAMLPKIKRKGWNSLSQLIWWTMWKERNRRIFDNTASMMQSILAVIMKEAEAWAAAGRRGANGMLHRPQEPD
jgi:hypothetical protein